MIQIIERNHWSEMKSDKDAFIDQNCHHHHRRHHPRHHDSITSSKLSNRSIEKHANNNFQHFAWSVSLAFFYENVSYPQKKTHQTTWLGTCHHHGEVYKQQPAILVEGIAIIYSNHLPGSSEWLFFWVSKRDQKVTWKKRAYWYSNIIIMYKYNPKDPGMS